MKKVTFNKITIQNFLSVGEEPIVLDFKKGLHLITGKNKDKPDRQNGVGKSTLADAIYFAIFGEPLRTIKKEFITNNNTGGKAQVELEFEVDSPKGNNKFHIIRTLSPTKVYVYKDGVDKTRDSTSNTTKYICEVLSASHAIFQNCVIMTVNNAIPFMAKNKTEKRKFIEDIFGLEIFSRMTSSLRQDYNDTKRDYDINSSKLDEISASYKNYKAQKDKVEEKKQEKRALYLKRFAANNVELESIKQLISSHGDIVDIDLIKSKVTRLEQKLKEGEEGCTNLVSEIANKKANLVHKKDHYKKIGTKDEMCPVCLRSIDEHDKTHIEQEKAQLKEDMFTLAGKIEIIATQLKECDTTKLKLKRAIQDQTKLISDTQLKIQSIESSTDRITQLEEWQEELTKDLDALSNERTEFDDLIAGAELRLNEIENVVKTISKKLSKLDIVKFVVSEEGVKSYIVNKLLELLNSKLYYYLKKLDSNSVCVFDEYFEEQIVNDNNKICSYFNFSGAERKAIDLACLFAFSDIRRMQGGVSYNIAIYDELFDSSFDAKGIELITEILQERVDTLNESAMVISHRSESIKAVTGDIIYLEKENGITRRVDYSEY